MTMRLEIPGRDPLELAFALLDVNGTVSNRGLLLDGVADRLEALQMTLQFQLVSADTFGTLAEIASHLGVPAQVSATADEKLAVLGRLGPDRCVAIGNGVNDAGIIREAALGIAVVGPEGASGAALSAADIVCSSILDALDLLAEPRVIAATLRR